MSAPTAPTRLWRVAGALTLAYLVLTFAGVAFLMTPEIGSAPKAISADLMTNSMPRAFAGGYIEFIAGLVLLAALLLFARLLRGTTEVSAWLSSCIAAAAITATAVGLATGFAAGGAAVYDGHHGASVATVATVNDIRNFGFFLSCALDGVLALSVAGAVQVTRLMPRWVAYTGYVVGALSIVSVIGARNGAHNLANMLFFVWLVAVAISSLRQGRHAVAVAPRTAVANA